MRGRWMMYCWNCSVNSNLLTRCSQACDFRNEMFSQCFKSFSSLVLVNYARSAKDDEKVFKQPFATAQKECVDSYFFVFQTFSEAYRNTSVQLPKLMNSATHCFIPASLAEKYNGIFKEGIILQIQGFEVRPCTKHNKITDHPFVIKFNNETTLIVEKESWLKIAKEKFRVHNHAHLVGFANTNLALPDVVGKIISIQGSNLCDPTSTNQIVVNLWLQPNVIVSLSLWAKTASRLRAILSGPISLTSVVLVTAVNPTILDGTTIFPNQKINP
ncbi:hypothetical protein ARALYDRAFT_907566 [Arabidopsis lyrata subsp. lyrata]|uniref:Replication protein A 70 kDa DNA-binding subunit B/D first OB fold domain-containing protein n=1 Tax=Arabidopsis lyrata subsp. lyrata TaxID=81972 RepID=D7LRQ3_ARALL|nr:hypothetical protein ARALYDRAFT_907566 [Arabidopsis lyrata subsp. lyrata]